MKRVLFGTRKRAILAVIVAALALPGAALAAWVIYTGATGSNIGGTFAAATTNTAITIAQSGGDNSYYTCTGPGSVCTLHTRVTNASGVAESIIPTGSTAVFSSVPADCASHLSLDPSFAAIGVAANATSAVTDMPIVKVDATLPNDCSGGTFSANLTLKTSP